MYILFKSIHSFTNLYILNKNQIECTLNTKSLAIGGSSEDFKIAFADVIIKFIIFLVKN